MCFHVALFMFAPRRCPGRYGFEDSEFTYASIGRTIFKSIQKFKNRMKSLQDASYIMEIWLQYQDIAEFFENLNKRKSSKVAMVLNTHMFMHSVKS